MKENRELYLAKEFVENTGENIFLTGKAGTGKTTFLRNLKENSHKRMIVVAPTGIAAMNAGGVTIHSFFQLSFAPYVPDLQLVSQKSYYKFSKEKINIIRSLNLLVIDEVSMVRADVMDAMDAVLRRYRDRDKPFGGVQLLLIGDMQQLAPVVKEEERILLERYYDTNFFFSSHALQKTNYHTIELKQVYRQSDMNFIHLLNKIRMNEADDFTIQELNKRYIPDFKLQDKEGYIMLTTHNYQANQINEKRLAALTTEPYAFTATIDGEFPEYLYPIDAKLVLKSGAQIMFIKNDSSPKKRYYNGKIGKVLRIDQHHIEVLGEGEKTPFIIEREKWQNTQYSLNAETKEITEKVAGTFSHYPIKLAWAITIHKSQGLTFDKAIIDANASFAHGQVYVALSRCRTLEGMILSSPLDRRTLINDESITSFTLEKEKNKPTEELLVKASNHYFYALVCELFSFKELGKSLNYFVRLIDEHLYRTYPALLSNYKIAGERFSKEIIDVSDKFYQQYTNLFMQYLSSQDISEDKLYERIYAGATYFHEKLRDILSEIVHSTKVDSDNKEVMKKITDILESLQEILCIKLLVLEASTKQFSISSYLSIKAKASIVEQKKKVREKKTKDSKEEKLDVPEDILHPELYECLKSWRNAEARRHNLPVYTILQQKAIIGITNLLPTTTKEMLRIPYLGKKNVDKYGPTIIAYVANYMKSHKIKKE